MDLLQIFLTHEPDMDTPDLKETLPLPAFDRELTLEDLLRGIDVDRLMSALERLLGAPVRLRDTPQHRQAVGTETLTPLHYDMETVGYLDTTAAKEATAAAADIITILFRASARYLMASDLHLSVIQQDYELLKEKNAALEISETKYRTLAEQLELRVAEQVGMIEQTQRAMFQSEKLAAVGQLAAGVAHEINNPVGFIRSNLNTAANYVEKLSRFSAIIETATDPTRLHNAWKQLDLGFIIDDFPVLLQESMTGATRVAQIVKDLKEFSNIDHTDTRNADLNEIIRHTCHLVTSRLPPSAKLTFVPGDIPMLRCQPGHIAQALMNVLINATQAITTAGQIAVSSRTDGKCIIILIQDDGCGMPNELLERVFEPFFTTREVGQGRGLGLTVCRDIIHAHGGNVSLISTPRAGTTVTINIPIES